ncbi:PREDICTED: uteroglobin isoform X1 [Rhinopithecus bieti]|uniref:uteroglobin isoform X1 n=1 Tax=Rhinopithecus bieti TaxID=61621 RepID=UPI00083C61FD|nr:PREDICTED: uteroglobin isoform X1 [Rhinopithecus bieti]
MKLTVGLTLVTLALCCSSASAKICPTFLRIIESLFLDTPSSFEAAMGIFSPDQDTSEAVAQLKKLVDTLPAKARDSIVKLMVTSALHFTLVRSGFSKWGCRVAPVFRPVSNPERRVTVPLSPDRQHSDLF